MKLLGTLLLAALGQFYDYADDVGKFGALQVVNPGAASSFVDNHGGGTVGGSRGHGGNKRYCHTTGHGQLVYNWTSNTNGGYFAKGRNIVQCIGEELYCFIEERAQFGQIIGISAGCEQMMNHPSVTIADQQSGNNINLVKNNYNQEAARGGTTFHGLQSFFGIGGCLSMPAQNGHQHTWNGEKYVGTDSAEWKEDKWNNYYRYYHGGYGQNQCLRFPKRHPSDNTLIHSPGNLLPFGVSVCRACCIAEFVVDPTQFDSAATAASICNYAPDVFNTIKGRTDGQFTEIVPRFDMKAAAENDYKTTSATVNNNLFVHASGNCQTAGRARGCRESSGTYSCGAGTVANDDADGFCPGS